MNFCYMYLEELSPMYFYACKSQNISMLYLVHVVKNNKMMTVKQDADRSMRIWTMITLHCTFLGGVYLWLKFMQSSNNDICIAGKWNTHKNCFQIKHWTKHIPTGFLGKLHFARSANQTAFDVMDIGSLILGSDKMCVAVSPNKIPGLHFHVV